MHFCNAINSCANVADEQWIMQVAHLRRLRTRKIERKPLTGVIIVEKPNYLVLQYICSAELQTSL